MALSPEERDALEQRVANGIVWLDEHDPGSRFHTWWQAGLTATSPLPAQEGTPEVKAAWVEYFERRRLWERLYARLEAAGPRPETVLPWQPSPIRR